MNMNREEILKQLTALDFAAVDFQLYLNTHPNDRNALMRYNHIVAQANILRQMYERMYGPLTSYRSCSGYPWQWINNPWPWDYSFNFNLPGEEM